MPRRQPRLSVARPLGRLESLESRDVPAVVPFALPQEVLSEVGYPYTTVAADLNGDGHSDVLAVATDGSAIVWAAGLGDGTFGARQTIDPGTPSGFIANTYVVDFNSDGKADVLAAGDDILNVYLNNGTGTFAAPITIASEGTFRAAFAADLDGDGHTDVLAITNTAAGSSSGGAALWYRNDGANSFSLGQTISVNFDGPRAATAGDLDGDGDIDFVVGANRANKIVLFRNDGAGNFGAEELVTSDIAGIRNLYTADLNGDGDLDLVSVAYGSSEVAWFANDGTGSFTKNVISNAAAGYFSAAVGDIDGNGTSDLAVAAFDDSSVSWFANDGAGNFGARLIVSTIPGGGGLLAIGVGDFNEDGRLDIVAGDTTDPYKVAVYENFNGGYDNVVIPPAAGTALIGQALDVKVHFGVPVTVTGAPEIDLDVGGATRAAVYVAGSGTPMLTFRYVVAASDVDLNGIELTSTSIRLAGGSLLDPDGGVVDPVLPAADLSGTKVNGSAPLVSSVSRLDSAQTNAHEVRFEVVFSEPVTGVDASDFAPRGELNSTRVKEVTGAGSTYIVTVSTGSGSGSLGLSALNDGTIVDGSGNPLGIGSAGGEVYTLHRRPARTIDTFFTADHGDIGIGFEEGAFHPHVHTDNLGEVEADGVLIVAGPDALRTTPTGPQWAFLGAGTQSYLLPETENPALPYLGIGAEEIPAGTLAGYFNADPRVDATGAWVGLQLVAYRGPAGSHVSLYNSGDPNPTVWWATSDGLDTSDVAYVLEGSHGHFNFAFTAAGNYELDVVASGYLDANGNGTFDPGIDPYIESGVTTYYFQIDPPAGPTSVDLPADPLAPVPPLPFGQSFVIGSGLGGGSSATAADLDGDGDLDLLVGAYGAGRMVWFENLGGSFGPERLIDAIDSVWFAEAADLDGDGDIDALATGYSGVLAWYANDGAGNFGTAQVIATGTNTLNLAIVDFDGDGITDILGTPDFDSTVDFYRGLGGGTFAPRQVLVSGIQNSIGLQAHDFDGDGDIDIAYGEYQTDEIHVYLNQGGGVLGPRSVFAGGDGVGILGYADFNADGHGDLLALEFNADRLAWHEGNGEGAFGPRQELPPVPGGPYARHVADVNGDTTPDVLSGSFGSQPHLVWLPNLGNGTFGPALVISQGAGQASAVLAADFDGDGDNDVVAVSFSLGQVQYFENRSGEFATEVIAPAEGTYLAEYRLDVGVHFGFPVDVTGAPQIDLEIGGTTVVAEYVSGSGTPRLAFRYVVQADDLDLDGIVLASAAIRLNGGTITDPTGEPVDLTLPNADFSGVKVNGSAPSILSVARLDANPTSAATVRFEVEFSEPVTGVDTADFAATPISGVTGGAVTGVSGSGAVYIVTVSTGSGSGALGLSVPATASISDLAGNAVGAGFTGGQVYTMNRRPSRTIDEFYSSGHGDLGIGYEDGEWDLHVHNDDGEFSASAIVLHGGPEGLRATPVGPEWAFLGAGPESYFWPQNGSNPDVPELGIGAEEMDATAFASYSNSDPRVNSVGAWIGFRAVAFRGPEGGHMSIYSSGDTGPTVWVATSDGLTDSDTVVLLAGSHNHYNFAFTAAGNYELDVVASGYLDANGNGTFDPGIDPYTESGVTTYYFQIDPPAGPTPIVLPADPLPQPSVVSAPTMGGVIVRVQDGASNFVTPFPGFGGSILTASGDFTGDGIVDLVAAVGAGGPAHVKVLDGVTGEVRMSFFAFDPSFTGGVTVAAGDVDGDGVADLIVGAGAGAGPHVKVFSGATGAEIRSFFAYDAGFTGGVSVAAGDLDGDGFAEIVTGTLTAAPHVRAFDGLTGAERLSFFAYAPTFTGGVYVAAGDLDGDGRAEIVTGTGFGGGSHVRVFDGTTAAERGGFFAYGPSFLGGVRVAVTDSDGDGRSEIVTGAGPGGGPHVKRFDGQTFDLLDSALAGDPNFLGGVFVG